MSGAARDPAGTRSGWHEPDDLDRWAAEIDEAAADARSRSMIRNGVLFDGDAAADEIRRRRRVRP